MSRSESQRGSAEGGVIFILIGQESYVVMRGGIEGLDGLEKHKAVSTRAVTCADMRIKLGRALIVIGGIKSRVAVYSVEFFQHGL